ncbi:hypothetical protein V492_00829 [Pseudogymnoascus sp. VKM F-4246]|nr:hypothetical protein V492_00829 [Pseudogymnoascus sp. VKM F-4246]
MPPRKSDVAKATSEEVAAVAPSTRPQPTQIHRDAPGEGCAPTQHADPGKRDASDDEVGDGVCGVPSDARERVRAGGEPEDGCAGGCAEGAGGPGVWGV